MCQNKQFKKWSLSLLCIIIGVVALVVGIVSRLMLSPIGPWAIESRAFAGFSALMLLLAIALTLLEKK